MTKPIERLRTLTDPGAAARLIASVPKFEDGQGINHANLIKELPWILESALDLLLEDVDIDTQAHSASGCRIIAACISRLSQVQPTH